MKRNYSIKHTLLVATTALFSTMAVQAQQRATEITRKNSWIKAGINAGIPIGSLADRSNLALGAEVKGQLMSTPNWGLGLASGYTHYFPATGHENFGSVPAAAFVRYYPARQGVFFGADLGYSFQTGSGTNAKGGVYARPQIGYHNRLWNIFGYYNGVFRKEANGGHLQHLGVGTTFNILFD